MRSGELHPLDFCSGGVKLKLHDEFWLVVTRPATLALGVSDPRSIYSDLLVVRKHTCYMLKSFGQHAAFHRRNIEAVFVSEGAHVVSEQPLT